MARVQMHSDLSFSQLTDQRTILDDERQRYFLMVKLKPEVKKLNFGAFLFLRALTSLIFSFLLDFFVFLLEDLYEV